MRPHPISLVVVLAAAGPVCAASSRGLSVRNRAPSTRGAFVPAVYPQLPSGTQAADLRSGFVLDLPAVAGGIMGPVPEAVEKDRLVAQAPAEAPVFLAGAKAASSLARLGTIAPVVEGAHASADWSGVEGSLQALWGEQPPRASRGSSGSSSRCTGFCGTFRRDRFPGGGGGSSQDPPPGGRGGGSSADGPQEGPGLKLFFPKGAAGYDRRVLIKILRANHFRLQRFLRRSFKLFPASLNGFQVHVRAIDHLTPKGESVIDAIEYTLLLRSGPGKKAKTYGHFRAKVDLRTLTLVLNVGR